MMKRYHRVVALTAMALALPAFGCGGEGSPTQTSTSPYESIPNYGGAIEKAQDAAAQAEKRAQEAQDALNEAIGSP